MIPLTVNEFIRWLSNRKRRKREVQQADDVNSFMVDATVGYVGNLDHTPRTRSDAPCGIPSANDRASMAVNIDFRAAEAHHQHTPRNALFGKPKFNKAGAVDDVIMDIPLISSSDTSQVTSKVEGDIEGAIASTSSTSQSCLPEGRPVFRHAHPSFQNQILKPPLRKSRPSPARATPPQRLQPSPSSVSSPPQPSQTSDGASREGSHRLRSSVSMSSHTVGHIDEQAVRHDYATERPPMEVASKYYGARKEVKCKKWQAAADDSTKGSDCITAVQRDLIASPNKHQTNYETDQTEKRFVEPKRSKRNVLPSSLFVPGLQIEIPTLISISLQDVTAPALTVAHGAQAAGTPRGGVFQAHFALGVERQALTTCIGSPAEMPASCTSLNSPRVVPIKPVAPSHSDKMGRRESHEKKNVPLVVPTRKCQTERSGSTNGLDRKNTAEGPLKSPRVLQTMMISNDSFSPSDHMQDHGASSGSFHSVHSSLASNQNHPTPPWSSSTSYASSLYGRDDGGERGAGGEGGGGGQRGGREDRRHRHVSSLPVVIKHVSLPAGRITSSPMARQDFEGGEVFEGEGTKGKSDSCPPEQVCIGNDWSESSQGITHCIQQNRNVEMLRTRPIRGRSPANLLLDAAPRVLESTAVHDRSSPVGNILAGVPADCWEASERRDACIKQPLANISNSTGTEPTLKRPVQPRRKNVVESDVVESAWSNCKNVVESNVEHPAAGWLLSQISGQVSSEGHDWEMPSRPSPGSDLSSDMRFRTPRFFPSPPTCIPRAPSLDEHARPQVLNLSLNAEPNLLRGGMDWGSWHAGDGVQEEDQDLSVLL